MKTSDFKSIDEMWEWVLRKTLSEFDFLVHSMGFQIEKTNIAPTQCTVEFRKDDVKVGIWIEYGNRPEVFIKAKENRLFTDRLIKMHAIGMELPVEASVFCERALKRDFQSLLHAYAEIIKTCIQEYIRRDS